MKPPKDTGDKTQAFTAFVHITCMPKSDFLIKAEELEPQKIFDQLAGEIYDLSMLTEARYNNIQAAYKRVQINIVIFILVIVLDIVIRNFMQCSMVSF